MIKSPEQLDQEPTPESSERLAIDNLLKEAKEAVGQICNDCKEGVAFNQAGSHGFDV